MTLRWTTWDGPVPAGPVPDDLVALAQRCRRADGGLPLADDPDFLRRRWAAPGGVRFGLRAPGGSLLAAGTTCPVADGVIVTGLVDPAARGRGLGAEVLDRCLALAAGETASITGAAAPAEPAATTPAPAASPLSGPRCRWDRLSAQQSRRRVVPPWLTPRRLPGRP